LCVRYGADTDVAVRSSAPPEDLIQFCRSAGNLLNVNGVQGVLEACHRCFAYPTVPFPSPEQRISPLQRCPPLVSKNGAFRFSLLFVMFSIDTETGFKNAALITAAWFGENVVQGAVNPMNTLFLSHFKRRVPPDSE